MAEDQPGSPGTSDHDDQPGQGPTEPLGGPAQPPEPPPGQPGTEVRSPARPRRCRATLRRARVRGGRATPRGAGWLLAALGVGIAAGPGFHATTAGQSIGIRILGIRVLDADTGRSLP
jgi:hypothetical protein